MLQYFHHRLRGKPKLKKGGILSKKEVGNVGLNGPARAVTQGPSKNGSMAAVADRGMKELFRNPNKVLSFPRSRSSSSVFFFSLPSFYLKLSLMYL